MIGRTNVGGGAGLNFKVVGGTTQPTGPAENTIWVNTDTPITEWEFSAEQPTSPAPGMVWIRIVLSSSNEFNALRKNNITIYPATAKQYVNSAWVTKEAERWNGSEWKPITKLPVDYQEVEYLQATGTQYINIDYIPGAKTGLSAKIMLNATATDVAFAAVQSAGGATNRWGVSYNSNKWSYGNMAGSVGAAGSIAINTPYNVEYNFKASKKLIVDGVELGSLGTSLNITHPIWLFALNNVGSAAHRGNATIYSLVISEENEVKRELVPCYRVADSVAGMYDLVNDVFYTNTGSGSFIVGGDA